MEQIISALVKTGNAVRCVDLSVAESGCILQEVTAAPGWLELAQRLQGPSEKSGPRRTRIAVFESSRVLFPRLEVPAVEKGQLGDIVRLQAETILPLPIEQMAWTFRPGTPAGGKQPILIAATRAAQAHRFMEEIEPCHPRRVLLDAEGLVAAWRELFAGADPRAAILYIGPAATQVCLAEDGLLAGGATIDLGRDDLFPAGQLAPAAVEQFAHDLRNTLDLFDPGSARTLPLYLLGTESALEQLISPLGELGLELKAGGAPRRIMPTGALTLKDINDNLPAIGAALAAARLGTKSLNLFPELHQRREKKKQQQRGGRLIAAAVIAAVLLAGYVGLSYSQDRGHLSAIQTQLEAAKKDAKTAQLHQVAQLRQLTRAQRLDVLELIKNIRDCVPQGMMFDKFAFARGQPVSVSGKVSSSSREQLLKLETNLQKAPGITNVERTTSSIDEKKNELPYTITFDYKDWTRKAGKKPAPEFQGGLLP